MSVENGITLSKVPRENEPGYTVDTIPKALQDQYLKSYRERYPQRPRGETSQMSAEERFMPPKGYVDAIDHHRVFQAAVRSRQAVTEDALFGYRAAGPALLSNISYFEGKVVRWDPEGMRLL